MRSGSDSGDSDDDVVMLTQDESDFLDAVRVGDIDGVIKLSEAGFTNVDVIDSEGMTPLMLAIDNSRLERVTEQTVKKLWNVATLLINLGADVSLRDYVGMTALMYASHEPKNMYASAKLVKSILTRSDYGRVALPKKNNADIHAVEELWGLNALMLAAEAGNLDAVKELCQHTDIDLNTRDSVERTALMIAAQKGHFYVVKFLVEEAGANIYSRDNKGKTALDLASGPNKGHIKCVLENAEREAQRVVLSHRGHSELASSGKEEGYRDEQGMSGLMHLSRGGDYDKFTEVFETAPAYYSKRQDDLGRTELVHAVMGRNLEIVKDLLRELLRYDQESINTRDIYGKSALMYAVDYKQVDIFKTLLENGADRSYVDINAREDMEDRENIERMKKDICDYISGNTNLNAAYGIKFRRVIEAHDRLTGRG